MFYLTLILVKTTNYLINIFKLGAGFTWPGYIALKFYPNILKDYSNRTDIKFIVVSGTNGKTTTSKIITHILNSTDTKVINNTSGANLLSGVVSALLLNTSLSGKVQFKYGVIEVDEFTLPLLLQNISPSIIVLLYLSRDQLDRYGEVDIVLDKWINALQNVPVSTSLVIDGTQAYFKKLTAVFKGSVYYFDNDTTVLDTTSLLGDFNAKNINAGILVGTCLGISKEFCISSIKNFVPAYGRGENIIFKNKQFQLFLAKNPMSFNNNLNLLVNASVLPDTVLFLLNDGIPDGRDVSWIYDIDPVLLKKACENKTIFIAGTRSLDFATRLHYAGVDLPWECVKESVEEIINTIVLNTKCKTVLVLPNYSAMLLTREFLTGRKIL
jgi:lipid II isoglutaminyl synthase (glutamine-hydrolysing)